ncbi:MAG: macro domain-containing protein, partial [Candidatus Syntropharchaeia archaeon]
MVRVRINNTVIEAYSGDITELGVDAVVIGANPMMEMNEGIAAIVKEKGGREIEEEAMSKIPVETGEAIVTSAGALNATHVIHAVAVYPDLTADENTIEKATENSLLAAENLKI